MTSATGRLGKHTSRLAGICALALAAGACASFVEIPIETPLQSKLDVGRFRRILVAGFVTEPGPAEVDLSAETSRLLQNQLRTASRLQVLEPDRPPLQEALDKLKSGMGAGEHWSKADKEQYQLDSEKLLQDGEYWRKLGEEYQTPLIVSGKIGFDEQNRSGFQAEERVVRDPASNRARLVRGNRFLERKAYTLSADFYFVDGKTGATLHREKFTEEVLYGDDQKVSPLSSYFELMDRLLPNFLGVISPQKIRGTRILLR